MDLKSMLIGDIHPSSSETTYNSLPTNTPTPIDPKTLADKSAILQLGGTLQAYLNKSTVLPKSTPSSHSNYTTGSASANSGNNKATVYIFFLKLMISSTFPP
ncbi:hypothetical protein BCR42DRAFT_198686 [Absidia repens]|uniref:Uncharacterized protein n=1 Tax=Absidia repens TaxID=90262 RepID=A0A1X2HX42_9FUNG|nr:hypothetical protein BCR42DRAFT_198686 [Absidia repens]